MTLANAIINKNIELVKQLIKEGADLNEIDEYGFTPLIEAVIVEDNNIAKLILEHLPIIDRQDVTGRSALYWATDNNNIEICKILLDKKANPNGHTYASQPILAFPLLRRQKHLVNLLISYGADLHFAQNYINTKLLGHRFELLGQTHIVTPNNKFILLDFEGFFLDASLSIIENSFYRFKKNYTAKNLKEYFSEFALIINALDNAAILSKLQHYTTDLKEHQKKIREIFSNELILIPAAYQGHAITFIKYKNYFAKCDRGSNSKFEGSSVIYEITNPSNLTHDLYKNIIYVKQTNEFMHSKINNILGLQKILELPIASQKVGNCSWANVEASIPTMLFLLLWQNPSSNLYHQTQKTIDLATNLLLFWQTWDGDRAIEECIQKFYDAKSNEKAAIATTLSVVLLKLIDNYDTNTSRINKILKILSLPEYIYIIKSYVDIYFTKQKTEKGDLLYNLYKMASILSYQH